MPEHEEIAAWQRGMASGQRLWTFDGGAVRSRVLFHSATVSLGRYEVAPWSSVWTSGDVIRAGPLLALTRTPVEIEQRDREAVVADHTCAVLHNAGWEYRRRPIDERGEDTLWLALSPATVLDVLGGVDDPTRPFEVSATPISGRDYLLCHAAARRLEEGGRIDAMEIEEALLRTAGGVLGGSPKPERGKMRESTRRAHREAAMRMRRYLSEGFRRPLSLEDVARSAFLSPFHAARVFKRETGMTIHENLRALRLREAMERIACGEERLAAVAAAVGFSSHAHLTDAFGSHFGVPPSVVRADPMGAARAVLSRAGDGE